MRVIQTLPFSNNLAGIFTWFELTFQASFKSRPKVVKGFEKIDVLFRLYAAVNKDIIEVFIWVD